MKIGTAVLLGMMALVIFPQAKHWLKHGPKGSNKDWQVFIIILAVIVGFIFLLIKLV